MNKLLRIRIAHNSFGYEVSTERSNDRYKTYKNITRESLVRLEILINDLTPDYIVFWNEEMVISFRVTK